MEQQPPSPTYLPPPPIYEDVRKGPHVYAEHDLNEDVPTATEDVPEVADEEAEEGAAEEEGPEPRTMSSFDNPLLRPLPAGGIRPPVYCLACYRLVHMKHWNVCPHCRCADSTVSEDDPIGRRCREARRLDDGTVILGPVLLLQVGPRITSFLWPE